MNAFSLAVAYDKLSRGIYTIYLSRDTMDMFIVNPTAHLYRNLPIVNIDGVLYLCNDAKCVRI